MLLISYRTYVTHAFLGSLFGIDDSADGRDINPLGPLLAGISRIPGRRIGLAEGEIRELVVAATERPTRRPARGQREFYSGRTKRHTIKAQVVVVRRRKPPGPGVQPRRLRIAAVSESQSGRVHDTKVDAATRVVVRPGVKRTGDTASLGTGRETPTRKPCGGELTGREKAGNRRVAAGHGIGRMEVWRVASERSRNPVSRHTLILKNGAGLPNLMFA